MYVKALDSFYPPLFSAIPHNTKNGRGKNNFLATAAWFKFGTLHDTESLCMKNQLHKPTIFGLTHAMSHYPTNY